MSEVYGINGTNKCRERLEIPRSGKLDVGSYDSSNPNADMLNANYLMTSGMCFLEIYGSAKSSMSINAGENNFVLPVAPNATMTLPVFNKSGKFVGTLVLSNGKTDAVLNLNDDTSLWSGVFISCCCVYSYSMDGVSPTETYSAEKSIRRVPV